MPDLSQHSRRLREIADSLEAQSKPSHDALAPHPATLRLINSRLAKRGQVNYALPKDLDIQRRIRRYHADHGTQPGDIAALALDAWLRSKGYPPDLSADESADG
ncbi:hypothetical protein [Streptomyces albipurpureus]|uniref:Uncharacterized protein n=1 Tax=Streptomyces albipurpureus TaxID=2897419 RepID=A0ABT0UQT5_9ACTN|nr:hypothetical protein [Streptomyces sp. CWNU-1]MCM2390972.1 hypothetical protein [Streptomyces sp. CWNU-1]